MKIWGHTLKLKQFTDRTMTEVGMIAIIWKFLTLLIYKYNFVSDIIFIKIFLLFKLMILENENENFEATEPRFRHHAN